MNNNCLKCGGPYLNFKIDLHGYPYDRDRYCKKCDCLSHVDICTFDVHIEYGTITFTYGTKRLMSGIALDLKKSGNLFHWYGNDQFNKLDISFGWAPQQKINMPYFRPDLSDIPKLIKKLNTITMLT